MQNSKITSTKHVARVKKLHLYKHLIAELWSAIKSSADEKHFILAVMN